MEIIFYYYYVLMNNNKPIGSGLKAIKYLRDKCKKKPTKSPLHKRINLKEKKSRLSIDRNVNLKVNTNIEYKGWKNK